MEPVYSLRLRRGYRRASRTASAWLVVVCVCLGGCAHRGPERAADVAPRGDESAAMAPATAEPPGRWGEPVATVALQRLENEGYVVGYSSETRTPLWVCYHIWAVGDAPAPRRDNVFAADDRVADPVGPGDYARTGYDRGHMAPRAPIGKRYGKAAQDKTFLMTNMCPQLPGLNQRGWEALERVISSNWAEVFEELWVYVGPIFEGPCRELPSGVRVPSHCYVIVVDVNEADTIRAIAVAMEQRRINREPLSDFVTTIDDIEARTGIDFLPDLPDDEENVLESSEPDDDWDPDQLLNPTFRGTPRPIDVRDCN
jgi:endonuclease G